MMTWMMMNDVFDVFNDDFVDKINNMLYVI